MNNDDQLINHLTCRDDFIQFAKSSKAVKALVEKQTKVSMKVQLSFFNGGLAVLGTLD